MEFLVDAGGVGANGAVGDLNLLRDFLLKAALGEEAQDFEFARGKLALYLGLGAWAGAVEGLHDAAGDGAAHGRAAFANLADGLEQLIAGDGLGQVTEGASGEGFKDRLGVVEDGDDDDLDIRQECGEAGDALGALHSGELQIHENEVGLQPGKVSEGLLGAMSEADKEMFAEFMELKGLRVIEGKRTVLELEDITYLNALYLNYFRLDNSNCPTCSKVHEAVIKDLYKLANFND